jgi:hypothetical protein
MNPAESLMRLSMFLFLACGLTYWLVENKNIALFLAALGGIAFIGLVIALILQSRNYRQ